MILRTTLPLIYSLALFVLLFLTGETWAADVQTVKIAPNKTGFILFPSGDRYVPWGHNYGSVDILERLAKEPARVARDFLREVFTHGGVRRFSNSLAENSTVPA